MIYHYDKGADIQKYNETAQGFLEVEGTVAHVGYLLYPRKDGGLDKEYVPIETLFAKEHIESTDTAVITLNHPPQGITVNPQYWNYSKGSIKSTIKKEDKKCLDVKMIIGSEDAIMAVKNGITCLSMGYEVEREQIGENEYVQTSRICNHIAIVQKGRASKAKIHFDSFENNYIDSKLKRFYNVSYSIKLKKIHL